MTRPYDLRTLEMVLATLDRQQKYLRRELARGGPLSLWDDGRLAQNTKLRNAIKRHAAKARKR